MLGVESLQHAGGEAWPLTLLASGDSLPLVLKISTSDHSSYRTLQSDMTVRITSRDVSVLAFDAGLAQCQDIMTETVNLPAPHTCATSFDGSALYLTFFADYALQPATTYLFATRLRLLAPGTMRQRTLLCEILEDFEVIDRFGIVIGTIAAMPPQPSLQLSEFLGSSWQVSPTSDIFQGSSFAVLSFKHLPRFRLSAAALSREQEFVLEVRLAAASAATAVDPGAQGSVLIWARPLGFKNFKLSCMEGFSMLAFSFPVLCKASDALGFLRREPLLRRDRQRCLRPRGGRHLHLPAIPGKQHRDGGRQHRAQCHFGFGSVSRMVFSLRVFPISGPDFFELCPVRSLE